MKTKRRPSYSISQEIKDEIKEMHRDGYNRNRIAIDYNISYTTVTNIIFPEKRRAVMKVYHDKNKEKVRKRAREYYKKYYRIPEKRKKILQDVHERYLRNKQNGK